MIKSIPELIGQLRVLNPSVTFDMGSNQESSYGEQLYSGLPADKLILPEGFVARDRYGITQIGTGKSPDDGIRSVDIRPLKQMTKEL